MRRDMTQREFDAACKRHGFTGRGWMGYYNLGIDGYEIHTSILNAGYRRRDQLAYLIAERKYFVKRQLEKVC